MFKIVFGGHLSKCCILFECWLEFDTDPRCLFFKFEVILATLIMELSV